LGGLGGPVLVPVQRHSHAAARQPGVPGGHRRIGAQCRGGEVSPWRPAQTGAPSGTTGRRPPVDHAGRRRGHPTGPDTTGNTPPTRPRRRNDSRNRHRCRSSTPRATHLSSSPQPGHPASVVTRSVTAGIRVHSPPRRAPHQVPGASGIWVKICDDPSRSRPHGRPAAWRWPR